MAVLYQSFKVWRILKTSKRSFNQHFPVNCISRHLIDTDSVATSNQDILLQNLKSASESSDILYTVKKHNSIMNSRHLMQAFRSILTLQKSDSSNMSNGEIVRSTNFRLLCQSMKSQVRSLDLNETIDTLKTLSYLGVPSTSKIVQILLNLVTKQVNDLSLQQITFLDFLMKDFDPCPLVEALKIALPIVFDAHLRIQINSENISQLTDLLYYASRKKLSVSTTDLLIDYLMKNRSDINFKNAKSIVRSICDLRITDESHRPLLHHSLDVIIDNISNCTFHDLDVILSKLAMRFSQKAYYFYHEEIVNSALKFMVENDIDFDDCVWTLRKAAKFSHVNIELLEHLAKKAEQNPQILERCGTVILFSFVGGLAQADFRPENWNILEPIILKNARTHLKQIELPWIKFMRDLCTLDCWPFDIYEKVFSESFLEKYLSRDYNMLDYLQLLALNQALASLCPWYNGPKAPQPLLDKAKEVNGTNVEEYPLKGALTKGFGSDRYVIDGVYTKLGHFIDHVIVLRKGGYPVAITQEPKVGKRVYIEDLPSYADCKIVAVMCIAASSYCNNTERLKGPIRLGLSSLEAMGPIVVPISIIAWERLFDQEKIPYLMEAIKQKCDFLYVDVSSQ